METKLDPNNTYTSLPRGGYLVDTSIGYVQIGAPPETIKDTMHLPKGVPRIFVLTDKMFDWIKGISLGEIEFPLYYNFFLQKKKTFVFCSEEQLPRIKNVLQESLFGPKQFDLSIDYDDMSSTGPVPDIKKEMLFFRNNLKLSDLVGIGVFKNNSFSYKGLTIKKNGNDNFEVSDQDTVIAEVPGSIEYTPTYHIGERLPEPYRPPLFSITCLGPSHGFDSKENTSGYIIWLNHHGIMVDPPVNSTEWLEDSNVNPKLIDGIILTHCHADHDAGTFQKILEEGRVTVYSTETIMNSFLQKYAALSDTPTEYLSKLFQFNRIRIGKPAFIHGGKFDMFYTLHSIPTIGFRMEFQDQTFVYTSDHNNDPEVHRELFDKQVISKERYDELCNFPWDSKVIYHESGIAPLHTPIAFLNSLPKAIQKKTVVYHIAQQDFPEKTNLTLATFGIENTLVFKTERPPYEKHYQILNALKHLDFFHDLPLEKIQEFITIVETENFKKGDCIIKKGTPGDKFFVIYSGNVSVESGNLEQRKLYGTYEYFGEVALVTDQLRAADVYAETDVTAFTIQRDKFLNFISGTEFENTLMRLAKIRSSETWNLLSTSQFFKHCTSSQKTWLESIFIPTEKTGQGTILREGDPLDFIYIIRDGEVEVQKNGSIVAKRSKGDFIGAMQKVHKNEPSDCTFTHQETVSLFAMKRDDILHFVESNPGLLMKLVYEQ